uniref:RxLR effector protein n=1 Tax=Spongospora subterranea TaxID=70186 RepID=A0A0H5REK4_9EUKA|eukprot:CRZ12448.1 hypothetical protein [Spongospora subterranea]
MANNNFFATCCIILLFFLFLKIETSEASRFLEHKEETNYLLLPSLQWRPVRPPGSNPGTNARTNMVSQVSQRNFVGRKEIFSHPPPLPTSSTEHQIKEESLSFTY